MKGTISLDSLIRDSRRLISDKWQRDYVWEKKQWCDFMDTIKLDTSDLQCNFIGGIISIQLPGDMAKWLTIFDGQERVITYTIILAVIRDRLREIRNKDYDSLDNDDSFLLDNYLGAITSTITDKKDTKITFKFNKELNEIYRSIILHKDIDTTLIEHKNNLICKAYRYFEKELSNYNLQQLEDFKDKMDCLGVYDMQCDTVTEASRIFANQNKGKQLTPNDHINNHIMQIIYANLGNSEEGDEWSDKISEMFKSINSTKEGKAFFSRYYYNKSGTWQKQSEIDKIISKEVNTISDIKDIYRFYQQEKGYYKYTNSEYMNNLNKILFPLYNDLIKFNISQENADVIKDTCTNIIIRSFICLSGGIHDNVFNGLVKEICSTPGDILDNPDKSLLSNFIIDKIKQDSEGKRSYEICILTDEELKESILSYNFYTSDVRDIILWKIERYLEQQSGVMEHISIEDATIDHIKPQCKQSNDKLEKNKIIDTIGNLTIMCKKDNSSKGKKDIKDVITKYSGSGLKINQDIAQHLENKDIWTDNDIIERTKYLSEIITKLI